MQRLIIEDDEGRRTTVPVMRSEITVGRRPGNTIRLTERNVSRVHARIVQEGENFVVEDLSRYGTRLNGERVQGSATLRVGDALSIGDYVLTLEASQAAAVATSGDNAWNVPDTDPAGHHLDNDDEPARLVILNGERRGQTFSLQVGQSFVVGRSQRADFVLDDVSVSKQHVQITPEGQGFVVEDMGSANGIEVNGTETRRAVLRQGDRVTVGQYVLQYLPPGATFVLAAAPEPAAVAVEAAAPAASGGTRSALMGAGVGALVVLVIGGIVLFALRESPQPASPPDSVAAAAPAADVPGLSAGQASLQRGQLALGNTAWEEAIAAFDEAIAAFDEEDDSRNLELARSFRVRAENELQHRRIYEEIGELAENRQFAEALQRFPEIPVGSHYRTRLADEEVGRVIVERYVDEVVEASDVVASQNRFQDALAMVGEAQNLADSHPRLAQQRERILAMENRRARPQERVAAVPTPAPAPRAAAPPTPPTPSSVQVTPPPRRSAPEAVAQPTQQARAPSPAPPAAQPSTPAELTPAERAARVAELKSQARTLGLRQRDYAGAVRVLEEARRMDPSDAEVNLMLYSNYQNWGRNRDAARAIERYLRQRPSDPRREQFEAFLNEHRDW